MKIRILLPVLALALSISACNGQTNPVMPAPPTSTGGSVAATAHFVPVSTNTPVPSATSTAIPPALPVLASPVLARVYFQDEHNGWGIAINGSGHVVRSVDGGITWLDATPPETGSIGYSANLTILNTTTVWVLVPGMDFFSGTLYRTSDGGVTWAFNPVPFGSGFVQFLDATNGRALADRGARAGAEAVEFFQTSDGGVTWTSRFHNDSSQPGSSGSLPLDGIKNGMTFLDANTGWVTGSIPEDGQVYLYVTQDGGVSWAQQSLPLPAAYAAYRYLTQTPIFFGKDGFLPLMIYKPGQTDFTFYTTHDSGLSWNGDPTDATKVIKPGLAAFADALHIWCWDGGTVIYSSTDGAQKWSGSSAALDLSGRLSQLEYVAAGASQFTGWALTRADDAGHSQLYRTTDGSTWTPIIP